MMYAFLPMAYGIQLPEITHRVDSNVRQRFWLRSDGILIFQIESVIIPYNRPFCNWLIQHIQNFLCFY